MRALMVNLLAGLRLALLLPVHPGQLRISSGQFWLLLVTCALTLGTTDWMLAEPPREFNPFGAWEIALYALCICLGAYLAARTARAPNLQFQLPFCLLAALVFLVPAGALLVFLVDTFASGENRHQFSMAFLLTWGWLVVMRALAACARMPLAPRALSALLTVALLVAPDLYYPQPGIWYTGWETDETAEGEPPPPPLDAEQIFFDQPGLLAESLRRMLPQHADTADLYVLAMAGYAGQDVFRSEIDQFERIVDATLGSGLRFLPLVNHRDTLARTPVASLTNLEAAAESLGRLMDSEDDVLMVYITSHGTEEHEIVLELGDLPLQQLTPERLAKALERARARWKIIVLSACFSGGFVQQLAGPDSLVITASRADRHSFGCDDQADMTWFGRAFLEEGIALGRGLEDAFLHAEAQIHKWELEQDLEHSEPQIHMGTEIRKKLQEMDLL